ncbi:molecular chaperone SurA [Xylella fastidiosa subsp. pauca]|uniref:peptidylprolyl isomerase n=1 Tax=Xylella fastidiosa TaxID=2371 RepID=UPI0005833C28|nr:peptidylprolyl isomerase [Xylella fastidiosa]ARO69354.1 molecular chaperone SurA [Xylella fastidiosa subsp. pauca]AVI21382.1 molecular chaperone SurA [Xylella fastidiosa]AVI23418.1 molecular chaperone SurA [Xylella fastidiosa]KIA58708.1 molecular chaperone SurA [Xylella fastidiosa]KXB10816.1 molecular chaperone SurA [Xylella fastidiosa]
MTRYFSIVLSLLLAVSCVFLPVASARQQQHQPLDRIVAVVDDNVVLKSELDRAIHNVKSQYVGHEGQLPPDEVLQRQVLERLILIKLQVARAQTNGIRVSDDELNQAISSIAENNKTSVDGLRQKLVAEGISFPEFRQSVRDEITVHHLRQGFAQSRIVVSEGEVDTALAQASSGAQYHLQHILVAVPDGATSQQIAIAQKKIDGIKSVIDKGELAFSAAAVRYSDSPNALESGDLGWRSLDEIPEAFAQMVQTMKPGQIVGPLRGTSGFQLLKLVEVRDSAAAAAGPRQMATEYHARHILVRITEKQNEAEAKAKIDTLRARIAGGADFQTVARESSEDANNSNQGGDLGWFPSDAFGADFGNHVKALADGNVSEPFRSAAGWHIVQRLGTRQTDVTRENQRAQIRDTIGQRKLEESYERFLRELRSEAYVSLQIEEPADDHQTPSAAVTPATGAVLPSATKH